MTDKIKSLEELIEGFYKDFYESFYCKDRSFLLRLEKTNGESIARYTELFIRRIAQEAFKAGLEEGRGWIKFECMTDKIPETLEKLIEKFPKAYAEVYTYEDWEGNVEWLEKYIRKSYFAGASAMMEIMKIEKEEYLEWYNQDDREGVDHLNDVVEQSREAGEAFLRHLTDKKKHPT